MEAAPTQIREITGFDGGAPGSKMKTNRDDVLEAEYSLSDGEGASTRGADPLAATCAT